MKRRSRLLVLAGVLLAAFWVSGVSLPGNRVQGCASGCATASADDAVARVLAMNVMHGFPRFAGTARRLDLLAAFIEREGVDIALLQEVPWLPWLGNGAERVAHASGMNHLFVRANGNARRIGFEEGVAVLSRFPLRDAGLLELGPRMGVFDHRVALHVVADLPAGPLSLVVSHLASGDAGINAGQLRALRGFVDAVAGPVTLIGADLNAPPESARVRAITAGWVDAWDTAGEGDGGTCCARDLRAPPPSQLRWRPDYLFVRVPAAGRTGAQPVFDIVSARRVLDQPLAEGEGWLRVSDHAGVLVELRVSTP